MEMKTDDVDIKMDHPDDRFFFAPLDEIRNIENIIFKLETTFRELQKVAEGMKPVEN
jgi:hypothetical protein